MRALQDYIGGWQQIQFGSGDRCLATAKHLRKEADELMAAVGELDSYVGPNRFNLLIKVGEELADIVILACGIAYRLGIDLFDATFDKMRVNAGRVWGQPDKDGIVEHIKEQSPC